MLQNLMAQIGHHQQMIDSCLTNEEKRLWMASMQNIRANHIHAVESMHTSGEEDADDEAQLIEQLHIFREAKDELTRVLDNHEGQSARVVGDAMCRNKVDE